MDKKRNALVRHLAEMPAAAIYALADKGYLFQGFELVQQCPVAQLSWSPDGATLTITLEARGTYRVSLSLLQGELSSSCNCGVWSPSGYCPHLVAALATMKKALSPASLPRVQLPEPYLAGIRKELPEAVLDQEALVGEEFSLAVEHRGDRTIFTLRRNGEPVTLAEPELPPSLRDFLRFMASPGAAGRVIEEFRYRFRGRYPIVYPDGAQNVALALEADRPRSILLHLDYRARMIRGERILDDGTPLDGACFADDFHYFDTGHRRIEPVADPSGAHLYQRIAFLLGENPENGVAPEGADFEVPATSFNRLMLSFAPPEFAHFLAHARLTLRGLPASARRVEPSYRIDIQQGEGRWRLLAEGVAEGVTFPLGADPFWLFFAPGRARLPHPLRAKKRMGTLIDGCFATLAATSRAEREHTIRTVLEREEFCKRGLKGEARQLLAAFCRCGDRPSSLLQLQDREWLAVEIDASRQARLLEIPYRLFGPHPFFDATCPGEMFLDRELLLKGLSRLRTDCAEAGFSLALEGETLEAVSWSFSLDATRSSIDWFELRPEVRFEGELVPEGEFLEAVQGGGVFRRNGMLMILDEQSSRNLALFAAHSKKGVVRVPRLQILDWITLRRHGVRLILSPEDEEILESLIHFERIPSLPVPARLQATLRNYQHEGYSWLAFLYRHRFGACLADDMGLGKTIQAIALLAGLREGIIAPVGSFGPHLVVVPPSLLFNWESEIDRFYPEFKVAVYRGAGRRAAFEGVDLVLTSYGVVQRDIEILSMLEFHVIVFDEAQSVKNIQAETTGAVRRLRGRFKLTLTGTPVENHLGEYYSVMDLALPGLLGPYESFRKGMGEENGPFLETLVRRTRPFILRRSKDMIASELPPKVETDLYLEMSPRQKALYVRTVAQVRATVAEAYDSRAPGQARIVALTAILKLRQICLSGRLLVPELRDGSPKIDFLVEQLRELFDEGHSVLVFSQFTSFLDLVEEGLDQANLNSYRLDGSTPVSRRKHLVQGFQESREPSVFLLSLKAGGRGLNLTRASYVFHLDPWWNPAVENQASDRAHRIGQQNQVTITRLLMRHSIEEKMMELKKRKLKLYRALLEHGELEGGVAIGREDFEFLLG